LILFAFKDRVSAEFAASDEQYRDISPNHLLFWEAIKWAYSEGYKIFDFGRTALSNTALMDFKNRWGTKIVDLPQFFYPLQAIQRNIEVEKSQGYRFIKKICTSAPDWALPPIGRFCYRHLG
jgi:lipid II:glycine glycyltransferase (peptidoglycan interpeptide bridge formation enzyme)